MAVDIHSLTIAQPYLLGPSPHSVTAQVLSRIHRELAALGSLERKAVLILLARAYDEYGDRR